MDDYGEVDEMPVVCEQCGYLDGAGETCLCRVIFDDGDESA